MYHVFEAEYEQHELLGSAETLELAWRLQRKSPYTYRDNNLDLYETTLERPALTHVGCNYLVIRYINKNKTRRHVRKGWKIGQRFEVMEDYKEREIGRGMNSHWERVE